MIRFGVCAGADRLDAVIEAGYDYIELGLSKIAAMCEEEFAALEEQIRKSPIKAESYNGFFPGEIAIVGENVDMDAIAAYAEKALSRASRLGGRIAVLGSGNSRRIPEGFSQDTARQQFCAVFDLCANIAGKYGMTVALEPLRAVECNFINTVAEGLSICKQVNNPHGKCLADFFHVYQSGESLDDIRSAGHWLVHTHIAAPDRTMPHTESDIEQCKLWAKVLKDCGYAGGMSLEGRFEEDFKADYTRTRKILDLFNE